MEIVLLIFAQENFGNWKRRDTLEDDTDGLDRKGFLQLRIMPCPLALIKKPTYALKFDQIEDYIAPKCMGLDD